MAKAVAILLTFFGISIVSFGFIRLIPGDPVLNLLGERGGSPEVVADLRARFGLDQSLPKQYVKFISNAVVGDLGTSIQSRRPVLGEFRERFAATFELGFFAMLFAVGLGIPFGIISAAKRNSVFDFGLMSVSLIGYSMPIFWWGLILILVFSVQLGWTPVSGRLDLAHDIKQWTGLLLVDTWQSERPFEAFQSALKHLILPAIVLGTVPLATIARMTRSSLLEVMGEDYIRTARSKGLSRFRVVVVHGVRNALIPVITVIGLMFGTIVTGAVLTETVFSWPGLGQWMVGSVLSRDYPVIQGGILLIAGLVMSINLVVDGIYLWANPRLRDQKS
jgi:dipeptide transport system permease protein